MTDIEERYAALVAAVLEWWAEHEYDTTGPYGDYNVYDREPDFVRLAQDTKERA